MKRVALIISLWLAGTSCGAATGLDVPSSSTKNGRSGSTDQAESGGTTSATTGGSGAGAQTSARDCSHVENDGGGGARATAFAACCECNWPVEGPWCQALLHVMPINHGFDDLLYQECIGARVPGCIMDHLDSCAKGFPVECLEVYAEQVDCLTIG